MDIGDLVYLPRETALETGVSMGRIIDESRHNYDFVVEINDHSGGVRQLDFNESELELKPDIKEGDEVQLPYHVARTTRNSVGVVDRVDGDKVKVKVLTSFGSNLLDFKKEELTLCE